VKIGRTLSSGKHGRDCPQSSTKREGEAGPRVVLWPAAGERGTLNASSFSDGRRACATPLRSAGAAGRNPRHCHHIPSHNHPFQRVSSRLTIPPLRLPFLQKETPNPHSQTLPHCSAPVTRLGLSCGTSGVRLRPVPLLRGIRTSPCPSPFLSAFARTLWPHLPPRTTTDRPGIWEAGYPGAATTRLGSWPLHRAG
jgi:hypothetical protein